jgi:pimeloyl-ACP methyl ester carboxylesterase
MEEREHFDIAGQANRRTIVLLHGLGVTRRWWHPQVAALSQHFQVVVPDLAGHGSQAEVPLTAERAAADLAELIAAEAAGPALVVGISLGGYIAMAHAVQNPEQTVGLVLSGCSMSMTGLNGLGMRLSGLMLKFKGAAWLEEQQIASFRKRISPDLLESVLHGGLFMETAVRSFASVTGRDYFTALQSYSHPVLLLNGEGDEPNRGPDERLVRRLPNARLEILPDAGHLCSLEQPEAYTRAVKTFAGDLDWEWGME